MVHPFLVGKQFYLRGLEEKDLTGNYFQWFNDQAVCLGNNHWRFPNNEYKMRSYLESIYRDNDKLVLAIIHKKRNVHIGNIALLDIDWINRNSNFAIIIGEKKYWGSGAGLEAGQLIISHGFNELGLVRIGCGTIDNNEGMKKLALKLGMKKEGRRKKAIYRNGKFHDLIDYGIVKQ